MGKLTPLRLLRQTLSSDQIDAGKRPIALGSRVCVRIRCDDGASGGTASGHAAALIQRRLRWCDSLLSAQVGLLCSRMGRRRTAGCTQSLQATSRSIWPTLRSGQCRVSVPRRLSRWREIRDYHAERWSSTSFCNCYPRGLQCRRIAKNRHPNNFG